MKSGSINLLEPSGPQRACYGTALSYVQCGMRGYWIPSYPSDQEFRVSECAVAEDSVSLSYDVASLHSMASRPLKMEVLFVFETSKIDYPVIWRPIREEPTSSSVCMFSIRNASTDFRYKPYSVFVLSIITANLILVDYDPHCVSKPILLRKRFFMCVCV